MSQTVILAALVALAFLRVIALVLESVSVRLTTSLKKLLSRQSENEKEEILLKYRTVDDAQASCSKQSFTEFEKDYLLNPVSNELEEKPIPKNVQEYINSFIECALERALERFLPKDVEDVDDVAEYSQHVEDLAVLGEAMELSEMYREKLGLSDKLSMAQIFAKVDEEAQALKVKLAQASKKEEVKNNEENA